MNIASRAIGVMQRKLRIIGILLLPLALVPFAAIAEVNDGTSSSTGQWTPVHRETVTDSDRHFRAAFRASPLSLVQAIDIAERLHTGSRTSAVSFDTSHNASYRVRTVKDKEIWENVIDVRTGRTDARETAWSLNELQTEERDNIKALKLIQQDLSDAVTIAEKAAGGKAMSGRLVKEGDQLNFLVVVLSDNSLKEVFLKPPRATLKRSLSGVRKN